MEAAIFAIVIGLILAVGLLGAGILIGRMVPEEDDTVTEEGDALAAELRCMAASGVSPKEQLILRSAAEYIEKGIGVCES